MKLAVIDLGTNTCNLLIAKIENGEYKILHQSKQLVKLGDNKIRANEISLQATERTLNALSEHQKIIGEYQVEKVKCIATSAVRSAENKVDFLDKIGNETGWLVKIVSGEKEAELIFKGVLLAFSKFSEPSVIIDIGGGSNELILAKEEALIWKESQATGMSRVINQFKLSDPLRPDEIETLQNYFLEKHSLAIKNCLENNVKTMVGCSGAFDTIADIIDVVDPGEKQRFTQEISLNSFYTVHNTLVKSTREERNRMKGMDQVRVDLIVPAVILIEKIISETDIERIIQTDFALREGVLYELMKVKV